MFSTPCVVQQWLEHMSSLFCCLHLLSTMPVLLTQRPHRCPNLAPVISVWSGMAVVLKNHDAWTCKKRQNREWNLQTLVPELPKSVSQGACWPLLFTSLTILSCFFWHCAARHFPFSPRLCFLITAGLKTATVKQTYMSWSVVLQQSVIKQLPLPALISFRKWLPLPANCLTM